MKINEVEKILDIPKATIRFYEKEGLLAPQRNTNSYRDYSAEDIELLKKIIVLRKIGVPVADVKQLLDHTLSLQEALSKNIVSLHEQMKELEGALNLCTLIQKKEVSLDSFDEDYYWDMIDAEEQAGNKFFAIVNDVIDFEKRVIADEFGLLDEEGKLRFSPGKSVAIAAGMCICGGLLWYFMDGMNPEAFIEGIFFPFVCIIISSVVGLPLFFVEKKNERAARIIKKIGMGLCVVFLIAIVLLMILTDV